MQRYGPEVFGGAEQACRDFASRMAGAGHEVSVLTSAALSYVDWANHYPVGEAELEGVRLHRLGVEAPRDHQVFGALQHRVMAGRKPVPWYLQREWMRQQGPQVPELPAWLERHAGEYDVVVFFTYLYWTTWAGLPVAAHRVPTLLHPTAHDEPPIYLGLFDAVFRHPDAFGFLTVEEADLVSRRFRVRRPSAVLGIGAELEVPGDPDGFRQRFGVGDRPFLLYVGRVDPHKGTEELYDHFVTYKQRHPGPLALVVLGEPVRPLPEHPDVFGTGYVDDETRRSGVRACTALVHPSFFESFSMVVTEAWAALKPVIVQGRCEVLRGQVVRSGGGLPYQGFGEFEAAVEAVTGDPRLADALAGAGRRFVEANYRWEDVLARYERLLWRTSILAP
ncbi:MAG TPA: glycosyltransferase family 4 protein [Acidimicrobiales bacterium]|nr:glycosyltransferase family 4 protein [Acidimicrobiales bacterium]